MEKIFSAIPFFYGATQKAPNTVRISIRMQDGIDGAMLTSAVGEAMGRYPYFCVKTVNTGTGLWLDTNHEPVVVHEGEDPPCLGTQETNHHLLAFSWLDDTIWLDFFHGIADGAGIFPLIRTVVYYYCKKRYNGDLSPEDIRLKGEGIPRQEAEEPYPQAVEEGIRPIGKVARKASLNLAEQGLCVPGHPMEHRISIPEGVFMKYSRNMDGSPAAVVTLLMFHAIDGLHPCADKPIICGMAMNTRKVLGKPLAHHSLVSQLFLEYKESMKHMDMEQQATCIRGMVMVQGQDENIMDSVRNNIRLFEKTDALPDVDSKRQMMQRVVSGFLDVDTFKVSYAGRCGMGASEQYIKSCYTSVDLNGSGIMLEMNAVNGQLFISFLQEWQEDVYLQAFLRELEKEEIPYQYEGCTPLRLSAVTIA